MADILLGPGGPSGVHLVVGVIGATLLLASLAGRLP
jgi:hypothetical protein